MKYRQAKKTAQALDLSNQPGYWPHQNHVVKALGRKNRALWNRLIKVSNTLRNKGLRIIPTCLPPGQS